MDVGFWAPKGMVSLDLVNLLNCDGMRGKGRIRRGGVKEVAPAPCRCLGFGVPGVLQHLLLLGGDGLHAVLQDNCSSFD